MVKREHFKNYYTCIFSTNQPTLIHHSNADVWKEKKCSIFRAILIYSYPNKILNISRGNRLPETSANTRTVEYSVDHGSFLLWSAKVTMPGTWGVSLSSSESSSGSAFNPLAWRINRIILGTLPEKIMQKDTYFPYLFLWIDAKLIGLSVGQLNSVDCSNVNLHCSLCIYISNGKISDSIWQHF